MRIEPPAGPQATPVNCSLPVEFGSSSSNSATWARRWPCRQRVKLDRQVLLSRGIDLRSTSPAVLGGSVHLGEVVAGLVRVTGSRSGSAVVTGAAQAGDQGRRPRAVYGDVWAHRRGAAARRHRSSRRSPRGGPGPAKRRRGDEDVRLAAARTCGRFPWEGSVSKAVVWRRETGSSSNASSAGSAARTTRRHWQPRRGPRGGPGRRRHPPGGRRR